MRFSQIALVVIFVVLQALRPPVDLDLGWHLRYGEHFFQTGRVLKENIISSVWPDYQWVQASWGYDLLVYQIFMHLGFFGLSLSAALITAGIFLVIVSPLHERSPVALFLLAIIFLTQTPPLYGTGLRSQTPSAFLFAVVLTVSMRLLSYPSAPLHASRFTLPASLLSFISLPFLFLLWANLHGGFSLGLILMMILWVLHGLSIKLIKVSRKTTGGTSRPSVGGPRPGTPTPARQSLTLQASSGGWVAAGLTSDRTRWRWIGIAIALSWLAPLVNPWGTRIYEETLKHSTNTNLTTITEWMPIPLLSLEAVVSTAVLVVTIAVTLRQKRISDVPYLLIVVLLWFMAMSALRFTILYGIAVTHQLARVFPSMTKKVALPLAVIVGSLVIADLAVGRHYFSVPSPELVRFSWSDYCQPAQVFGGLVRDCSEELAAVMSAHPPQGNGYNPYNTGGYLTWRVPQVKTFVDGRMAAWERNGQTPPLDEADRILHETSPVAFRKLDSAYQFQWVVIPSDAPLARYMETFVENGMWERRFRDDSFSYYVKQSP